MGNASQRKTILINKDLQLKIAGIFVLAMVLGIVLSNCLFYTLVLRRGQANDESWETYIRPLIYTNVFSSLVVMGLAVYLTIFISHRIAGPMFRFSKLMEQVGKGDFNIDPRLRKDDELIAFASGMGRMADNL